MASNSHTVVKVAQKIYQNEWVRSEIKRLAKDPKVQAAVKKGTQTVVSKANGALQNRKKTKKSSPGSGQV